MKPAPKPATALPWKIVAGQSEREIFRADDVTHSIARCGFQGEKNAAYVVHACNAYPRLVAALREAYLTVHPGMPVEYRIKLAAIGDLLRELGEL